MNQFKLFFQEKRWKDDKISLALSLGGIFLVFFGLELALTIQRYFEGEKDHVLYGIMSLIWLGASLAFLVFAFQSKKEEEKPEEKN